MEFVRSFERQCSSQAGVRRLRGHPSYSSFHSKWNLPVYFQLRCITSTLHTRRHKPASDESGSHTHQPVLPRHWWPV